jgi:hypothetical protein
MVKGVTETCSYHLPTTLENDLIPNTKEEVASPSVVQAHPHLAHLSDNFLEVDSTARVLLLIGRDGLLMEITILLLTTPLLGGPWWGLFALSALGFSIP